MKYTLDTGRNGTQIGDGRGTGPRQLYGPVAVTVDEEINAVYISDFENNRIQRYTEGELGLTVETVIQRPPPDDFETGVFSQADDIHLDPLSRDVLYISETSLERISRWQLHATLSNTSIHLRSRGPVGIYVDAQRNIYVAEHDGQKISRWLAGRRVAGTGRRGNALNQFKDPMAVTVDSDGRMFIVDSSNHRIMRWEANATQGICMVGCSTTSGNRADQLAEPADLTFDWQGNLLVADLRNNRVQRFDLFVNASCGKYRAFSSIMNAECSLIFSCFIVNSMVVHVMYSSALTTASRAYSLTNCSISHHFYEALQLTNVTTGYYRISSNSSIDPRVFVYQATFHPLSLSRNLIAEKSGKLGFHLSISLQINVTYILIVTSVVSNRTGSYSVFLEGPSRINARRIGKLDRFSVRPRLLSHFPLFRHATR